MEQLAFSSKDRWIFEEVTFIFFMESIAIMAKNSLKKKSTAVYGNLSFDEIAQVEKPIQLPPREQYDVSAQLEEAGNLVNAGAARRHHNVSGKGFAVAVLDTGINAGHLGFNGRVTKQRNYTGGDFHDASDRNGHGTNVAGAVGLDFTAANGTRLVGVANKVDLWAIKVLNDQGSGSFRNVQQALLDLVPDAASGKLAAVNMSLGASNNLQTLPDNDPIVQVIATLASHGVPVVISAGNDFFNDQSEGMSYPAIAHNSISVGAVYDDVAGGFSYASGAQATITSPDMITPFTQRFSKHTSKKFGTDIFAPGAPLTSAGFGAEGLSTQHGTSQAAPVTAGAIALMQEIHVRHTGKLSTVQYLLNVLERSSVELIDTETADDNVTNTGKKYQRLDIKKALDVMVSEL